MYNDQRLLDYNATIDDDTMRGAFYTLLTYVIKKQREDSDAHDVLAKASALVRGDE